MKRVTVFLLLVVSVSCFGQAVKSGSTVYIEPMDGYETYLAAAFAKKHVPLIVVADQGKADYIITGNVEHKDLSSGQPSVVVNNSNTLVANGNTSYNEGFAAAKQRAAERAAERRALGETSASISIIDPQTSQIVFAYSAGKMGKNQIQKTSEDCAKHLREFIDKPAR